MRTFILLAVLCLFGQGTAMAADAKAGKVIFDAVCSHCHRTDYDDKFGPGLGGIKDRVSDAWLDAWLQDPEAMVKTDEYAKALRESNDYGMTMPQIPAMKDPKSRADVIEYLKTLE